MALARVTEAFALRLRGRCGCCQLEASIEVARQEAAAYKQALEHALTVTELPHAEKKPATSTLGAIASAAVSNRRRGKPRGTGQSRELAPQLVRLAVANGALLGDAVQRARPLTSDLSFPLLVRSSATKRGGGLQTQ